MADNNESVQPLRLGTHPLTTELGTESDDTLELTERLDEGEGPVILMLDIETLGLGARPVVLQLGLFGLNPGEDTIMEDRVFTHLPIQPQLDLINPRTITGNTIAFWMDQSDEARAQFQYNVAEDFESLPVLMRHFTRGFNRMVAGRDYEMWCRGLNFDVPITASLFTDCGMVAPWETPQDYWRVRDLRTLMAAAGVNKRDVPPPQGYVPHMANWDCRWQLAQYLEARRQLRARR